MSMISILEDVQQDFNDLKWVLECKKDISEKVRIKQAKVIVKRLEKNFEQFIQSKMK